MNFNDRSNTKLPTLSHGHHQTHQVFNLLENNARAPIGGLVNCDDIDSKIEFEKLPRRIKEDFRLHNRLEGSYRDASEAVLKLILTAAPVSKSMLVEKFGIDPKDVKFVIDYVSIRVRTYICDREDELRRYRFLEDWMDLLELYDPLVVD